MHRKHRRLSLSNSEKKRRKQLCKKYHDGEISLSELAREMKINVNSAYFYYRRYYKSYCTEEKKQGKWKQGRPPLSVEEKERRHQLCKKYHDRKISIDELADNIGITRGNAYQYYSLNYRSLYNKKGERKKKYCWSNELIRDNIDPNKTQSENARHIGFCVHSIKRVAEEMGITLPKYKNKEPKESSD